VYDLRIVVEEIRGFCDLPLRPGDYIEVKGGRLHIPDGRYFCIWALQSLMPMVPVKQRQLAEDNDWVPDTHRMVCPDPNGQVIFRFERIPAGGTVSERTDDSSSGVPLPPKRILVDVSACDACGKCERACREAHREGAPAGESRMWVAADDRTTPVRLDICRQCGAARCVEVCPEGALRREPTTRAVLAESHRCNGCGRCVEACPFSAMRISPETGMVLVCDLCGGSPACVAACPTSALAYGLALGKTG